MNKEREFDVIIWGGTGFTGSLVVEYIYNNYKTKVLNGQLLVEVLTN